MSDIIIDVPQEYEGERIDKFLSILLENSSRNAIQKLIEDCKVLANGNTVNKKYKVKKNLELNRFCPI